MRPTICILSIALLCISYAYSQQQYCTDFRSNECEGCLNPDDGLDCAFCTSPHGSGCFNTTFASNCGLVGGELNNCAATGSDCADILYCEECQAATGCTFCVTGFGSGYCLATGFFGQAICNGVEGSWNPPLDECPPDSGTVTSSATSTTTSSSASSSSGTGQPTTSETSPEPTGYAIVDPNANCERYDGQYCTGAVFYNVFVNDTYGQTQMSGDVSLLVTFSYFPGVTVACRDIALKLTCGDYFQRCEKLPDTDIVVSIPACKSLCLEVNSVCREVLEPVDLLLNCEEIDGRTGVERFPLSNIQYLYEGKIYDFPCNDMAPPADNDGYYPNQLQNPGFELVENGAATFWESLYSPMDYTVLYNEFVLGENSTIIQMESLNGEPHMIRQLAVISNPNALRINIAGYSKAEGVTGERDDGYAICVEVQYIGDNTTVTTMCQPFNTGTHDYELEQLEWQPTSPVYTATFYVSFANHSGVASFENMILRERIPDAPAQDCPYPFISHEDHEPDEDYCVLECPSLLVWDNADTYLNTFAMGKIVGCISLALSTFLLLTWIVRKERKGYPDRLLYYFTFGVWLVSIRACIMTFMPVNDLICYSKYESLTQVNSPVKCLLIGAMLQFSAASVIGWWLCITFTSWVTITHHMKQKKYDYLEKYMHIGVWGFALTSTVVPAAFQKYDTGLASSLGCWLTGQDGSWWMFACFYIPLGIMLAIGAPMVFHTCYTIYSITRNSSGTGGGVAGTYIRLMGFLGIVFINFIFLFGYKFYTFHNEDRWYAEFERETICVARGNTPEECQGGRVSAFLAMLNTFVIASEGILTFLFFGLSRRNWDYWVETLTCGKYSTRADTTMPRSSKNKSGNSKSEDGDRNRSFNHSSRYGSTVELQSLDSVRSSIDYESSADIPAYVQQEAPQVARPQVPGRPPIPPRPSMPPRPTSYQ